MPPSFRLLPFAVKNICSRRCAQQPVTFCRSYWQRRNMFSELSSAMQTMENSMREMDKEMNRIFNDFQRGGPVKIAKTLSPFDWLRTKEIPVVSKDGSGRTYQLQLDMQGMEPEDISISLKRDELTITARKEEKREDGSHFIREQKYHYTLPKEINPDALRSTLADGILTIEAPLPAIEAKEIPVKIDNDADNDQDSKKK